MNADGMIFPKYLSYFFVISGYLVINEFTKGHH